MDNLSLFLLALGLSLDDFALAFAICLILPSPTTNMSRFKHTTKMALAFAVSTALLPLLGWVIGIAIFDWVSLFSAWVILVVFCGVGAWIIREAFEEDKDKWKEKDITSVWVLVTLGVLGSLDEGAVGIGYPFLDVPIVVIITWVIIVNTILVFVAALVTMWTSRLNQEIPSVLSGTILICLGITNWIEIFF
jgi:putative Mn2+ efflux pump MntP